MRVWRVENDNGVGPYRAKQTPALEEMSMRHSYSKYHPTIYDDTEVWQGRNCGFSSRAQLDAWFEGYFPVLALEGFHVAVYEVPDTNVSRGRSGRQLCFSKRHAMPITTQTLDGVGDRECMW